MKPIHPKLVLSALVLAATAACAQVPTAPPVVNIDPARHGNLASAQQLVLGAYDRLGEAQAANDSRLGGHAARAKELLRQANDELKLAALTANQR